MTPIGHRWPQDLEELRTTAKARDAEKMKHCFFRDSWIPLVNVDAILEDSVKTKGSFPCEANPRVIAEEVLVVMTAAEVRIKMVSVKLAG